MEHARRYTLTFVALLLLTTATFLLHYLNAGYWSVVIAMSIALTKSVLIVLFFMHLIDQHASNWIAFVVSVLLLCSLIAIAMLDVFTRGDVEMLPRVIPGFR